jgi:hypothetical protein
MTFAPHMPFPIGKQEIPQISVGPYTGKPWEGFGPIGTYDPNTDESKVVPLDFLNTFLDERLLAKGRSPLSTPYWDKQDDIRKYLENIRRLKERGLLGGLPKA